MRNYLIIALATTCLVAGCKNESQPIDRHALLERNSPVVHQFDSLSTLTVGNGRFAYSVDASGLQTFPEKYSKGVPLGTMSDWGWHSFPNTENYSFDETLVECDFGRGHKEIYSSQTSKAQAAEAEKAGGAVWKAFQRKRAAIDFVRKNPHRLHLGTLGLYLHEETGFEAFTDIDQKLDLESGMITSSYKLNGEPVRVQTCANPRVSLIAVRIEAQSPKPIVIRMPYPTGGHSDDACLWIDDDSKHSTSIEAKSDKDFIVRHNFPEVEVFDEFGQKSIQDYSYWLDIELDSCQATIEQVGPNKVVITPKSPVFSFTCEWCSNTSRNESESDYDPSGIVARNQEAAAEYWHKYWYEGGIVDFSHCKAPEAAELERRVVLSQYLLAVNCAGNTPPQETGLTYNSWFGKYHLEMIWWHQAQFALYGHPELLQRSLAWYKQAEPVARLIAQRQGFKGVRWMKMTDPSAMEAPSSTGSFLIWQQPHYIYLSELVRRAYAAQGDDKKVAEVTSEYYDLVQKTAEFMYDFAVYDTMPNHYILKGAIPAQETLKASKTINSPFELSQWHFTMGIANEWRKRHEGMQNMDWDEMRDKLSPLHYISDSVYSEKYGLLYTASEDSEDTYRDIRLTSDHMAVLGALGIFPKCPLVREDIMRNTLNWVWDNWNWGKTWGWDYPMTAMCAVRLGEPEMAVKVLLGNKRTNTYLLSGHNYQDARLRLYLPGNGGLLTAVALMCAGWDGCSETNPGFPKDGNWDVRWEGLQPMP